MTDDDFVVAVPTRSARTLGVVRGVVQVVCALEGVLHEVVDQAVSSALALQRAPVCESSIGGEAVFLSTRDAAALASVHPATLRDWLRRGLVREHRAGREIRVRRDELVAFLERAASAPTAINLEDRAAQILEQHRRRR